MTVIGVLLLPPGAVSVIDAGGQVEKKPAELEALETFALIRVEPGCCAVATPFGSIETMLFVLPPVAENERCPTWQLMLVCALKGAMPLTKAGADTATVFVPIAVMVVPAGKVVFAPLVMVCPTLRPLMVDTCVMVLLPTVARPVNGFDPA